VDFCRFAVETVAGRFIRWLIPEISGSCQITQFLWGSDAVVAFVSVCTTGTQRLFSRLTTVSISTGVAHRIANAHAHQQDVLSIAPRVRCVGCGAG